MSKIVQCPIFRISLIICHSSKSTFAEIVAIFEHGVFPVRFMSNWIFFDAFIDFFDFCQCVDSMVFGFVVVKGLDRENLPKKGRFLESFICGGDLANYGLIPLIFEELRVLYNCRWFLLRLNTNIYLCLKNPSIYRNFSFILVSLNFGEGINTQKGMSVSSLSLSGTSTNAPFIFGSVELLYSSSVMILNSFPISKVRKG